MFLYIHCWGFLEILRSVIVEQQKIKLIHLVQLLDLTPRKLFKVFHIFKCLVGGVKFSKGLAFGEVVGQVLPSDNVQEVFFKSLHFSNHIIIHFTIETLHVLRLPMSINLTLLGEWLGTAVPTVVLLKNHFHKFGEVHGL